MDDRDDAKEEGSDLHYSAGHDATIFLIDASAPMFVKTEDEDCPFVQALRCAHNILRNKIFTAPQDSMAVVFFGTSKTAQEEDKYGVYANTLILQDLQVPRREFIQELEKFWEMPGRVEEFKAAALPKASVVLGDPFWLCSAIFTKQ